MRRILISIMCLVATAMAYEDIDDNLDYNTVLNNRTLLHEFFGCLLDRSPCAENTLHIKNHATDAILTKCASCDDYQKHLSRTFLAALKMYYPEDFEEYKKKFDPDGAHYAAFEEAMSKY